MRWLLNLNAGALRKEGWGRLLIIIGLVAAAATLIVTTNHPGRLPSGDLYEASRQRLLQADFTYRLSYFWEGISAPGTLPGIGGPGELRERAIADYEREILVAKPNPAALHRLGIIYGQRGYREQAEQALTRAATLDEPRASLYFALAQVFGPQDGKTPLPATLLPRLSQQERWLAAPSLTAFYQLTGDQKAAAEARLAQARQTFLFGLQSLLLLAIYGGLGLVGVIIVIRAIIRRGFFIPPPAPVRPPLVVPWEPLDVLEGIGVLYFVMALMGVLAGLAVHRLPQTPAADTTRAIIITCQYLLFSAAVITYIWRKVRAPRSRRLRALGVRANHVVRLIGEGLGGYGILVVILGVSGLGSPSGALTGYLAALQSGERLIANMQTLPAKVLLFVLICIVAPLVEELIFRGFVYAGLRRRMNVSAAVLASAVIFALMHTNPQGILPITLIGIVLASLYERNRSIVPSVICHALNNTLVFFIMILAQ